MNNHQNDIIICERCGSTNTGNICEYCGILLRNIENEAEEQVALEKYITILEKTPIEQKATIIKTGFIPKYISNLRQAGKHIEKYVWVFTKEEKKNNIEEAATARMRAIISRLSLIPEGKERNSLIRQYNRDILIRDIGITTLVVYSIIILFLSCIVFPYILLHSWQ
jgi:hypothetical protein